MKCVLGGQLGSNNAVAVIFPQRDFGSAAPFSMHQGMPMVARPSRSPRSLYSAVLGEMNGWMIAVVLQ